MNKKKHEPRFHIVKRDNLSRGKSWGIRILAILLALVVCSIVTMILTGDNPIGIYQSFLKGAFGSTRKTWVTIRDTGIMLIIALALTPAFKMRFWNIGGEGQVMVGALAAGACMITLDTILPSAGVMIAMVIASILAGAVWGLIPAFFKAKWGTNETLFTLMMNYIATQLMAYFIIVWEVPKGSGNIGIINQKTQIGWLPEIGNKYLLTIIIAVLVTVGMQIYLKYTKHGYEIAVVGESEQTARYVGINVQKVIIRTMAISGAICGIAGLLLVGSINHTMNTSIVGGQGFTAVMVSWLAKFNPFIMVLTSLLIVFLNKGAGDVSTSFGLNESFSDILTGILLFFIIGCEFFINYKITKNHKSGKEEA